MISSDGEAWRPACGECGSTSLTPAPDGYRCASCGAAWDGSEAGEPAREGDLPPPVLVIRLDPDPLDVDPKPDEGDAEFRRRLERLYLGELADPACEKGTP